MVQSPDSPDLLIQIYNGTVNGDNLVATINEGNNTKNNILERFPDAQTIKVAGREGLRAEDEYGVYLYLFSSGNGTNKTLVFFFDPDFPAVIDEVQETLVIK